MSLKKFENGDVFYNTLKTKPHYEIKIYLGVATINNDDSYIKLNSLNINSQ